MIVFDKDTFLEKTKEAMVALQEQAMQLIREGRIKEADLLKAERNIYICYCTTYSAHWYDRNDLEALQEFINYDMRVQTGYIAKTEDEMQEILRSDANEGVKKTAMAKHRGYVGLMSIFNSCFKEVN